MLLFGINRDVLKNKVGILGLFGEVCEDFLRSVGGYGRKIQKILMISGHTQSARRERAPPFEGACGHLELDPGIGERYPKIVRSRGYLRV